VKRIEFEGVLHEFPDDFTDDEIASALGGGAPAAKPGPSGVAVSDVAMPLTPPGPRESRPIRAGVQGALGRGIAELMGFIPDTVNAGANLLIAGADKASQFAGGPELPFRFGSVTEGISDTGGKLAEAAGIEVMDPDQMDAREKWAYNMNRFGTQAAGGAAGLIKAAIKRAPEIAAGAFPRFGDNVLKPYMGGASGKTIAGDAAAAVGAGTGVTAAEEFGPKDSALTQALAALTGGVGGVAALGATTGAVKGIAKAAGRPFGTHIDKSIPIDPVTGNAITKNTSDEVARLIQESATDPNSVPGFVRSNQAALAPLSDAPTAMQMSEDPGLAALDRMLGMQKPGEEMARQRRVNTSVRDAVDASVPEGATPEALVARAQAEADARTGAAEGKLKTAQGRAGKVEDIRAGHGEEVAANKGKGVQASQRLHTAVEEPYLESRAYKNAHFDNIDPKGEMAVDADPIVQTATRIRDEAGKLNPNQALPNDFMSRVNALVPEEGGPAQITMRDLVEARKFLSTAYEKARGDGNFDLADNINALRRSINDVVSDAPEAADANAVYRDFAQTYRPNRSDEMAKFTREVDQGAAPPPSQTANRFLRPGEPEKSAALSRTIDPEGQSAAKDYLMADLAERGAVSRDGTLDARKIETWARENANNLDVVPGLRAEVDDLLTRARKGQRVAATAGERVAAAEKNVKQTQRDIDKSALGKVLNADPDKAVHAVMSDPLRSGKSLDELIKLTDGDEAARNGLKAAVHRYIIDKGTTTATEKMVAGDRRGPVSAAKLTQIFNEHEKELAKIFSAEEMNGLRAGHRALEISNVERLRTGSGSDTTEKVQMIEKFLKSTVGKGLEAALRLKFGMLRGGGIIAILRRNLSGITDQSGEEIARLVERARTDPELLIHLTGRKLPVGTAAWNKKLNQLMAAGEGAREVNDDE
jgi:hypothetical protein